jgi:xylulokinase
MITLEGHYIGIDVGTQGTKTVLCRGKDGALVAESRASYPLVEKADGTREQNPADWVDAVQKTVREIIAASGVKDSSTDSCPWTMGGM